MNKHSMRNSESTIIMTIAEAPFQSGDHIQQQRHKMTEKSHFSVEIKGTMRGSLFPGGHVMDWQPVQGVICFHPMGAGMGSSPPLTLTSVEQVYKMDERNQSYQQTSELMREILKMADHCITLLQRV